MLGKRLLKSSNIKTTKDRRLPRTFSSCMRAGTGCHPAPEQGTLLAQGLAERLAPAPAFVAHHSGSFPDCDQLVGAQALMQFVQAVGPVYVEVDGLEFA